LFLFAGFVAASFQFPSASALIISNINGHRYLSSYAGQAVIPIKGIVIAKGLVVFGFAPRPWISIYRSSNSIYVCGSSAGMILTVGDTIILDATVFECPSSSEYLYLTELISPTNIKVISSGNKVTPIIIGEWLLKYPPTDLWPLIYGLDFWESMCGELVTARKPTAVANPGFYGRYMGSRVSGRNERLDGSNNPKGAKLAILGKSSREWLLRLSDYYRILPLTALNVTSSAQPVLPPPTTLVSSGDCKKLSVRSYNVEKLWPKPAHLSNISAHIVDYFMLLQKIQDNGATSDKVVNDNLTLSTLVEAIRVKSNRTYAFTDINPEDGLDGRQPGGNIRSLTSTTPSSSASATRAWDPAQTPTPCSPAQS
ncbi:hypothetical protein LSUE1_G004342, partial [Lachnellula suecica]